MKRKVKRYSGTQGSDVEIGSVPSPDVEEKSLYDVENMKRGKFANYTPTTDIEEGSRPGKNLAFEPDVTPKPRPRVVKPKPINVSSGASGFPVDANMERGSDVMARGRAGPSDSGKNAPLEAYKRDKKHREFNEARKSAAEERKKTARSTVASSPVTGAGFKKGGSVGSASKRADGIAQRGKTKGRML